MSDVVNPREKAQFRVEGGHRHTRQVKRTCRLNSRIPDLLVKITTPPPGGGQTAQLQAPEAPRYLGMIKIATCQTLTIVHFFYF